MAGWSDEEFDTFVAARLAALVRFAFALTGDLGHAEDLVQTALLKVYLRSRRMAPDNPERYVRRAVVNANLSRFRRHRVPEFTPDDAARFATYTASHVGSRLAVLLDERVALAPLITSRIAGPVDITGTEADKRMLEQVVRRLRASPVR